MLPLIRPEPMGDVDQAPETQRSSGVEVSGARSVSDCDEYAATCVAGDPRLLALAEAVDSVRASTPLGDYSRDAEAFVERWLVQSALALSREALSEFLRAVTAAQRNAERTAHLEHAADRYAAMLGAH